MQSAHGESPSQLGTGVWLPDDLPPHLGEYELLRHLGGGGMGRVYEARHRLLRDRVAVKLLRPQLNSDPRFLARFRREIAAHGAVKDQVHVVRASYAGEAGGLLYLVMDFIDGLDVEQVLGRYGPFPPEAACEVIRQAALGLEAIHQAGMVHRDLKPSNLMLTPTGTVKILDLGLARLGESDEANEELTPTSCQLGTYDYQAPEQADDAHRVDIRADLYSLGCTLYKLLTGVPPYRDWRTPPQKLRAHAEQPFPPLPAFAPAGLAIILARLVAKDPAQRFATPQELADAIAPLARTAELTRLFAAPSVQSSVDANVDTPARAHSPTIATPAVPTQKRRGPFRLAVAGLLVGGLGFGSWLLLHPKDAEPDLVLPVAVPLPERTEPHPVVPAPAAIPADGIWPSGTTLFRTDDLPRYEQHDLLDRSPVEAYWVVGGSVTAFRLYQPGRKQLTVNGPRESLLHLGAIQRPSFTFLVKISQPNWTAGVGIYFGYHETPKGAAFQYLQFTERSGPLNERILRISRGRARQMPGGFEREGVVAQDIPHPFQEQVLAFKVVHHSLAEVTLNDKRLPDLTTPAANAQFAPVDYQGALGVQNLASTCSYRHALLSILDDR